MVEEVTGGQPRPTSGQFFSSLQSCPQRAWADYHLPANLKAKPPAFLGALQQEGVEHERRIYRELFPDALEIPAHLPPAVRAKKTIEAMESGVPAILQAYFIGEGCVGVADVLEWCAVAPSSPVGHLYQVGEVKRSSALAMAHVLQAAWYTELLAEIQKALFDEAKTRLDANIIDGVTDFAGVESYFGAAADDDEAGGVFKGWLRVAWSKPTGDALEGVTERLKRLKLTIRNAPLEQPAGALPPCVFTGAPSVETILLARSY